MNSRDMITDRDIIIVGQQPWDVEIGSNCKNLALEFSKHNRVLYINSPLDRFSYIKHKEVPGIQKRIAVIRGKEKGIVQIGDNIWNYFPDVMIESINWIPYHFIHKLLNKRNNKLFADSILKAANELGFKNYILFNDNDMFRSFYLKEYLKPDVSVYYSRDFMLGVDYWKYHGQVLEPQLIAKSDVCVANSVYLANYCKNYNSNSFYVGQGCDLSIFKGHDADQMPQDIAPINRPIIGYVGALQSIRLDIALLEQIAREKAEWSIVLVGPEDREFTASDLHNIPNVHFLGSKDPQDLPSYIDAFDVCINPQVVNNVTIGNYPRKIDEYLAMGKPVVATRTEAMSVFEEYVYLAENAKDYIELISKALAEDDGQLHQQRIDFASTHSWENNAKQIYEAINTVSAVLHEH